MPLDDLPMPLFGALKGPYRFRAIVTTRGCPHHRTFCSVRRFFGDTVRFRPISHVVAEIDAAPGLFYFNADDNTGTLPEKGMGGAISVTLIPPGDDTQIPWIYAPWIEL